MNLRLSPTHLPFKPISLARGILPPLSDIASLLRGDPLAFLEDACCSLFFVCLGTGKEEPLELSNPPLTI